MRWIYFLAPILPILVAAIFVLFYQDFAQSDLPAAVGASVGMHQNSEATPLANFQSETAESTPANPKGLTKLQTFNTVGPLCMSQPSSFLVSMAETKSGVEQTGDQSKRVELRLASGQSVWGTEIPCQFSRDMPYPIPAHLTYIPIGEPSEAGDSLVIIELVFPGEIYHWEDAIQWVENHYELEAAVLELAKDPTYIYRTKGDVQFAPHMTFSYGLEPNADTVVRFTSHLVASQ